MEFLKPQVVKEMKKGTCRNPLAQAAQRQVRAAWLRNATVLTSGKGGTAQTWEGALDEFPQGKQRPREEVDNLTVKEEQRV